MKKLLFSALVLSLTFSVCYGSPKDGLTKCVLVADTLKKDSVDPVCKMKVKTGTTRTHTYNNVVYGFCAESCRKSFIKKPEKYLKKKTDK